VASAVGDNPDRGQVFELDIERVMHKQRVAGLRYSVWPAQT
jgi:hypothetical protein